MRKPAAILVGSVALIGIFGCILYSFYIRWQAEACLNAIRQLHVGSSTMEDARKLFAPFQRYETDGTADIAGKEYPTHTYLIGNTGVHLLGIFHKAGLGAGVTFRDGVVISKGAGFFQEPFYSVHARESIVGLSPDPSVDETASGMIEDGEDSSPTMRVLLDTRASEKDRKAAFDYNLGCFTSLIGCRSVYEILPGVKHLDGR
jgi:hypothetical protein